VQHIGTMGRLPRDDMTTPPSRPAGYSSTPLARKLGIVAGCRLVTRHAPAGYDGWVAPLPEGVVRSTHVTAAADVVHLFVDTRTVLALELTAARKALRGAAAVWVSWPKKSSRVPTDITEDVIRAVALPMGWVDVKVCAVTEVWSGLKLVVRKELR
jgi:hypothetical protein